MTDMERIQLRDSKTLAMAHRLTEEDKLQISKNAKKAFNDKEDWNRATGHKLFSELPEEDQKLVKKAFHKIFTIHYIREKFGEEINE